MVASGGFTRERGKARYRKRKPIPAIVIAVSPGGGRDRGLDEGHHQGVGRRTPQWPARRPPSRRRPGGRRRRRRRRPRPRSRAPSCRTTRWTRSRRNPPARSRSRSTTPAASAAPATQASIQLQQDGFQVPPAAERPAVPEARHEVPGPDPLRRQRRVGGPHGEPAWCRAPSWSGTTARTPRWTWPSARSSPPSRRAARPSRPCSSLRPVGIPTPHPPGWPAGPEQRPAATQPEPAGSGPLQPVLNGATQDERQRIRTPPAKRPGRIRTFALTAGKRTRPRPGSAFDESILQGR